MPEIVLGADVPYLRVILQSGFTQTFGLTLQVESADLVGVEGKLDFGQISHTAVLVNTTYTWTFTAIDVAALTNRSSAVLSMGNTEGRTILGRGIVEVRL